MAEEGTPNTPPVDDQPPITPEEAAKLREQNQRLKGQLTDTEKRYNQVVSIYKDIDPDEVKQLRQAKEEAERKAAENDPAKARELHQRELSKVTERYEPQIKTLSEENANLKRLNKELAVTDRVMSKITKHFTDDGLDLLKRVVQEHCDLDDDGTIVIKGDDGEVLYKGNRPMTVEEYGEELREKYPSLARATGTPGGKDATPGEKRQGRFKIPQTWDEWQAMPNRDAVYEQMSYEDKLKMAKTKRLG